LDSRSQSSIKGVARPLRRTVTPYIGEGIILTTVIAGSCYVANAKHQPAFYWASIAVALLYASYVALFGVRYRVSFDDSAITMRAAGGKRVIRYGEIAAVQYEVRPSQSRPIRRIVILGDNTALKNFIDVSVRHFNLDDIAALLKTVHDRRPDLAIPKNWAA
jgi:hypothetical protein